MKSRKLKGLFAGIFLFGFLYLFLLSFIESISIPQNIHLSPGQHLNLSVQFPFGFYSKDPLVKPTDYHKLLINSNQVSNYNVELRAFGKIPIRKLTITVKQPYRVVPGGQSVGVLYSSRGVVIVGIVPLKGVDSNEYNPAQKAGLKIGDIILAVDKTPVNLVDEVEEQLNKYHNVQHKLILTIKREEKVLEVSVQPVLALANSAQKRYMLGIMIEDPAAGVGTLSFYDPINRRFAGLGHRISDFAGKKEIPFENGEIVLADITGLKIGTPGKPGEKVGLFNVSMEPIGKIIKNTQYGIYGSLNNNYQMTQEATVPVAFNSEIKIGSAQIYTVLRGNLVESFEVRIIKVFSQNKPHDKGLVIKVTDPNLLRLTGGIIQGMSGSPIIQNGKLVGAVTHVFVNDPTKGYGVLAEWMVQEMNDNEDSTLKAS